MKRSISILVFLALVFWVVFAKAICASDEKRVCKTDSSQVHHVVVADDGKGKVNENAIRRQRMSSSAFPVHMKVRGNALCVTSDYAQLLPIYTRGGTFYMAMRLNRGLNWLNGLPRGRYIINNQQISIP